MTRRRGLRALMLLVAVVALLFSRAEPYGTPDLHGVIFRLWMIDIDFYRANMIHGGTGYFGGIVPPGGRQ